MKDAFSGILPAVVTPLDGAGRFQEGPFERLLGRLYGAGVHGVYVCGTTGEGVLQSSEQRKRVAEAAVASSPPGKRVIVHVGARSTAEAVALAEHAAAAGADAVSSLPPLGNYSFAEVHAYYERLAQASGVPLLLYFFPAASPAVTSLDELLALCALPNVAGLKFTDFDLYKLATLHAEGYAVLNGKDEVLAAGLLMGADGGIGSFYNLVPAWFVRLYDLARAGAWEEARAVQRDINRLIRLTLRFPALAAHKAMLAWSGIDCGACLLPHRPLSKEEEGELKAELERTGLAEAVLSQSVERRA